MLNHIIIHGYLGRDPELKEYTNAKGEKGSLVNLSVGVGRDQGDETDWFKVTAFGKRAEVIDKWFHKGSQIIIWGRMQSNKGKDDHIYWGINANGFDFAGGSDGQGKGKDSNGSGSDSWEEAQRDIPF